MSKGEVTPRDRLAELMRMRDVSGYWLAEKAGVSKSLINGFLSGEHNRMSLDNWAKIAKVLDISLDWVVGLPPRENWALQPDEEELLRLWRKVQLGLIKETTFSTLRAAVALEELDQLKASAR